MPVARSPFILAIDIGTSSVRTALFDHNARRLPATLAQQPHAVTHSDDGAAELPPAVLTDGLTACLKRTLARTGGQKVTAVGVSCFCHGLVGTNAAGKAVTPIFTWADSRCRDDAAELREEMSEKTYHRQTGCMLRASFWPAKLRWLARTKPRMFRRVERWQSPSDWLAGLFCDGGADACSLGMATGTGLLSPRKLRWQDDLVERCGIKPKQLCALSEEPLPVNAAVRRSFPPLAEARWWPAIGDGAASNLGSGATRPGRAAINFGTSAAFRVMKQGTDAHSPFGLFCYRVDARRYVVGGAVSNAGNLRAWCRRELNLPASESAIDRALATRPGPLRSLVALPFWSAERAPTWREDLTGVVQGFSQNTTALDLLQATTEAVFHRLALIADLSLAGADATAATEIIVSGGILKSMGLLQRLADVLGRPIHPSREPEASLRGAAVYALEKMGCHADAHSDFGRLARPAICPRPGYAEAFAVERQRQQRLEAALIGAATDKKRQ